MLNSPSADTSLQAATRILWIRHGETAWNTEKRFQGHLDIPLNANGEIQAQQLAERIGKSFRSPSGIGHQPVIHRLYASDLSRARHTANAIADRLGLQVATLQSLRERNYGDLAGLTAGEMAERFPEVYPGLAKRDPDAELPAGESLRGFYNRIIDATCNLVKAHAGETLCVVVHGGVLDCIYRHAKGIDLQKPRDWLLPNVSLNVVDHLPGEWIIHAWGDTAHLLQKAQDEVDGRIV